MADFNEVKHPGKLLLSEITKLGMKQKELAIRTGMSEKHISTIINVCFLCSKTRYRTW